VPRAAASLADLLGFNDHCIDRYRIRTGQPASSNPGRLRDELRHLVAARGVPRRDAPSWFFVQRDTDFYVTIDGRWVLPVQWAQTLDDASIRSPVRRGHIRHARPRGRRPRRPHRRTLAALINIPSRLVRTWSAAAANGGDLAAQCLRDTIAARGRAHRHAPALAAGDPAA
jgi:hypothetical protein